MLSIEQMSSAPDDFLFTTAEASVFIKMSVGWLNLKAMTGDGIPFYKRSFRSKRLYRKSDLVAWLNDSLKKVNHTSEYTLISERKGHNG